MKKIYLKEIYEDKFIEFLIINEQNHAYADASKVLIVKRFLDKNFVRGNVSELSDEGYPILKGIVGLKDANGQTVKNLTDVQLFYMLQDKFKNIMPDNESRDNFLKQIIKDWYTKEKQLNNGILSK